MKDWKKKSVFLNVQLQTAENELPLFYIKLMHQSKKNAHSANQYPINTATDSQSILMACVEALAEGVPEYLIARHSTHTMV